ncbi:ethanolamine permease [Haliangium ochraceum]|uniref:Ethanolamine transproter n=1 Tax=Haliangium ochraceum (strain DSM 14365 / JCM 11303 / SMP-2) TaxID=502025 RepID=D0LMC5_HALO1|nr:ethanolamine permease [Haliangium ochraceum]ACY16831.1 ethanolamine transproter [Haliangium ochraceum DSM 14365]
MTPTSKTPTPKNAPIRSGAASYLHVEQEYLDDRQLHKSAGWVLLFALGVGAVISGDFFGWQEGLIAGGFGGLLIATCIIAIMYFCMVFSIAEMSAAMPTAGGFYGFTRTAFGPNLAFINSVTDMVEYVVTPAVIVVGIASYADNLVDLPNWVWWAGFYALFVAINVWGTELTFRVSLVITALSVLVLVVFYVGTLVTGSFDPALLTNIPPDEAHAGASSFLPNGYYGIWAALPFAIWFYLAIEQLPLAAEESHDVRRDMPRALLWGMVTLFVLSVCTLVLNSGVGGGALEVGASGDPLFIGFTQIFGSGATATLLNLIALTGLISSFHAVIYAYGRVIFAASRSGYIPRGLSKVSRRKTPHRALILGGVIGFVLALIIDQQGSDGTVGGALLTMAVFGATISYALVMVTYLFFAKKRPNMERPYKSPLGVPGAVVGLIISLIALVATLAIESNRPGVVGTALFVAVMFAYYWFYSRHKLVANSPEEAIALVQEAESEIV